MAKGGVLYNTPEEIRQKVDESIASGELENDEAFNAELNNLKAKVERASEATKIRNVNLLDRVRQFQEDVAKVVGGDAVKISVNTEDGFIGELATVTIGSKRMCLTDMSFIEAYKDIIYSIDISDYKDGYFEFIVAFKGAILGIKEGDKE